MKNLKRLENETRLHFIWRVYSYQEDVGGLTNDQCGEICRIELNETFNESSYRKVAQSFFSVFKEVRNEYIAEDSELLAEMDKKKDELYKQQVKTSDKNREMRNMLRLQARGENLKDLAIEVASSMPEFKLVPQIRQNEGKEAILCLSDWHYGSEIDNFWGKYNTEICKQRVEHLMNETLYHCAKYDVTKLFVVGLGDLIDGNIHTSVRVMAEEDVISQIMGVSELLANLLSGLNLKVEVEYHSVLDNHSRINKKSEHIEKESFARLIDWYLQERLKNSTVLFVENAIDENIGFFKSGEKNVFFVHGHLDKSSTIIQDMSISTGVIADVVLMGHLHHKSVKEFHMRKVYINGSMAGTGEYAVGIRKFSKPSQTLLIFDGNSEIDITINF